MANTVQKGQQRWMQTHSQRSAQHTLPTSPFFPPFLQHLLRLAVGLPKVIVFFVYFLVQPSPACMFYLCCCYHHDPLPPSFSPSLSSQSHVRLVHPMSPPPIVLAHSRQRQNSVGMNTPNATRMGNIRLLLSAAYGFGVRGPDWTL